MLQDGDGDSTAGTRLSAGPWPEVELAGKDVEAHGCESECDVESCM